MTYEQAVRTYWRINTIWKQNLGGITVGDALHELNRAQRATPLASPMYKHMASLINDIVDNASDPVELEEAV